MSVVSVGHDQLNVNQGDGVPSLPSASIGVTCHQYSPSLRRVGIAYAVAEVVIGEPVIWFTPCCGSLLEIVSLYCGEPCTDVQSSSSGCG